MPKKGRRAVLGLDTHRFVENLPTLVFSVLWDRAKDILACLLLQSCK
jgi:hypothetical protein